MCMFVCMYICSICVLSDFRGWEWELELLELELHAVVSCCVGLGNQNLGPLQEQHMLVSTESSRQPLMTLFKSPQPVI